MKSKAFIKKIPIVGRTATYFGQKVRNVLFPGSQEYWETRYKAGGNSGSGSYNRLAEFKAGFLNDFVASGGIDSIIEFGCGDGNQLSYARYPKYIGVDVSRTALLRCIRKFSCDPSKSFFLYDPVLFADKRGIFRADLSLSLDVIYHIIEQEIYEKYLSDLFGAARKCVIIYSTNFDSGQEYHCRNREFTKYVSEKFCNWRLDSIIKNKHPFSPGDIGNTSLADFFIYKHELMH